MADMSTHQMLDDTDLTVEAAHVTSDTFAIAGYVNGSFANWAQIVAKWGNSGKYLLSIDVANNPSVGAQCLDIEQGDATVADAPNWFKATQAAGKAASDLRYYPKLYTSAGNVAALVQAMSNAGIARNEYMIWSAHYTDQAHICGPSTCGYPQADATQWTSKFNGASLDASLCYGYFFAGPQDSVPAASTAPAHTAPVAASKLAKPALGQADASYRGVTLHWTSVKGAQEYDVQLVSDGVQVGRVQVKELTASFPVEGSTKYEWRVASLPNGEWSAEDTFTTPATPVPDPVTLPATGAATAPPASTSGTGTVAPPAPAPTVYLTEVITAAQSAVTGLPEGSIVFYPTKAS